MEKRTFRVLAWKDEFPLAVTAFFPKGDTQDAEKFVVVISCGTGLFQSFYTRFASWLVKQNVTVVTWDYRYIGDSLPLHIPRHASAETRIQVLKSPEAAKCTITEHWGQRDQPAVVEFVLNQFKGYKLCMVGHSIGGHIMPLLPERLRSQIFRVVFVGVSNPNWYYIPTYFVERFRELWANALDITQKMGYLPRTALIFGITLPSGPALELGGAILGENKRYLAGIPEVASFYTSWVPKNEVVSLIFNDDITIMADAISVDAWCEILSQARITRVLISPEEYGWKGIGHVGMFNEHQDGLWEMIHGIIVDGEIPAKGATRRWNRGKAKL